MGCFMSKNAVDESAHAPRPRPRNVTFQLSKPGQPSNIPESLGKKAKGPKRSRLPPRQIAQFQDTRTLDPRSAVLSNEGSHVEDPSSRMKAYYLPKKYNPKGPAQVATFAEYIEDPSAYRIVWANRLED
ncbi:hypothetical protein PV08_10583 [Exophiala spinifera]|uniref:Uncharacterized protein n=1 Tax=Exophiala spinifera TaxID=91928 RepID=A0A0D2AX44_9EURO|nr:uncharacterized protein PV08_10583 [Exophiala spinifera]KIW11283.1 hypothetical protein PV08_10583 [Exophiala spinifera]